MLAMSPLFPNLGWEYPQSINLENWNLDSFTLPNYPTEDDYSNQDQVIIKRSESSPRSTSSADDYGVNNNVVVAKKLNHNASERDRRKKINNLYSTLRDLLPATDYTKKLSIPVTVSRALKYIPELQNEVDELIHKKDELLSKLSRLQGITSDKKPKKLKEDSKDDLPNSWSICTSIIGDNEIVIQISTFDNISLFEVINKLENDGLIVLDVSSFRSFGGTTFYNLHLWSDGANNTITCEKLNEELPFLIQGINLINKDKLLDSNLTWI